MCGIIGAEKENQMSGIFKSKTTLGTWCVLSNDEVVADGVSYAEANRIYSDMVFARGAAAARFLRESAQRR